jgi:hypothetical protein
MTGLPSEAERLGSPQVQTQRILIDWRFFVCQGDGLLDRDLLEQHGADLVGSNGCVDSPRQLFLEADPTL